MADEERTFDLDKQIDSVLEKYSKSSASEGDKDTGMSSVSRVAGKGKSTDVIAQVDSKGVFKSDKPKELLLDLISRTNFRSRAERIYFLDWVEWCEAFNVNFSHPLLYLASARSENAESIHQLIEALTSFSHYEYSAKGKGRSDKQPKTNEGPVQ